jgi:cation diffusion facilitator CzcD-associated flavoprotein CzcO
VSIAEAPTQPTQNTPFNNPAVPVVIVGAGPAGLALGYHLKQSGVPFVILDRESAGATWRHHYDHLALHSLKSLSRLPGLPMPEHYPRFPTGEQVHAYLKGYAKHFDLPVRSGVSVQRVVRKGERWWLETNQGSLTTDVLVAATGIWHQPKLPAVPGLADFAGTVMHSRDYKRPEDFAGKRVLVVGAGNSGTEIATALTKTAAAVGLAVGSGVMFVPYPKTALGSRLSSRLLRVLPASVSGWLLARLRKNFAHLGLPLPNINLRYAYPVVGYETADAVSRGVLTTHRALTRVDEHEAEFADGERALYDTIIMATGYRPALSFLEEVLTPSQTHAVPSQLKDFQLTNVPDVFFFGYDYPETEAWLHRLPKKSAKAAVLITTKVLQALVTK